MKTATKKLSDVRELSSLIFLLGTFAVVGIVNPSFLLEPANVISAINGSVLYVFLAVGVSFVIMTGDIDVSVGSIMGLTAAVSGTLIRDGMSYAIVIPLTLLLGSFLGFINGFGVAKLRVPAIIMTLGTSGIIRGYIYIYTEGAWVENIPEEFKSLYQITLMNTVNLFFIIAFVLVVLIFLVMRFASFGKYFHALGDNAGGAALIGIPVARTRILAFVLSGLFSAISGLVFTSQVGFVSTTAGTGYEMTAIAACVIGGISLSGGMGSVVGAAIGAVFMGSISRILVFMQFSSDWNNVITGALLLIIVVADSLLQRRRKDKARKQRLLVKSKIGESGQTAEGGAQ